MVNMEGVFEQPAATQRGPARLQERTGEYMEHIVLLGDSIFDNALYVNAGTEVAAQLRTRLGARHRVSLLARDGAVLEDIVAQVARLDDLPGPPTHLVVSGGGNDVLGLVGAMQAPAASVLEAVELLASWQAAFRRDYRRMLHVVLSRKKPVALATIYDGVPGLAAGLKAALAPFNDVIVREAGQHGLPVLDLRLACNEPGDYARASPIEPSEQGGRKIAATIAEWITADMAAARTVLYGAAASGTQ
jgi:lysophospholipase L1-like esterase